MSQGRIVSTQAKHITALKRVLDQVELFPSEMLDDMIAPFFAGADDEIWLSFCDNEAAVAGFCYAKREPLTEGTWNMLALGVLPEQQGSGAGGVLTKALENTLRKQAQNVLIVDTSSDDGYSAARAFYQKQGYEEEARIRDFWAPGDDKITFRKSLTA